MNTKTYNGWANYETWCAFTWMHEGGGEYYEEQARKFLNRPTDRESAVDDLTDWLRNEFVENMPKLIGIYADLLQSAMDEIDFRELAEHIVNDINDIEL